MLTAVNVFEKKNTSNSFFLVSKHTHYPLRDPSDQSGMMHNDPLSLADVLDTHADVAR